MVICNAFSLGMLDKKESIIKVKEVSIEEVKHLLLFKPFESCIGHLSTAQVVSQLLGIDIPAQRKEIKIQEGEMIVVQIMTRLEEGKILNKEEVESLYKQGKIKFFYVKVE